MPNKWHISCAHNDNIFISKLDRGYLSICTYNNIGSCKQTAISSLPPIKIRFVTRNIFPITTNTTTQISTVYIPSELTSNWLIKMLLSNCCRLFSGRSELERIIYMLVKWVTLWEFLSLHESFLSLRGNMPLSLPLFLLSWVFLLPQPWLLIILICVD